MLEQHELVERVVPLHKEDTPRKSSTEILVTVVRISPNCTLGAPLGLRNLGGHAVLLGDELLRDLGDRVHGEGEPVVLLGVGVEAHLEVVSREERRRRIGRMKRH